MKSDREKIVNIITDMIEDVDEYGIFPTTKAYDKLEMFIAEQRMLTMGWTIADACITLDNGEDPRKIEISGKVPRMYKDLGVY